MNGPGLHNLLRRVGRLVLAVDVAAGVMTGLALITAAVVLCLLLDAALSLPAGGLLTLDTMLAVVACASLCLIGRGVVRNRYDPRRVAVMIERRLDVADSRLINAVDLCDRPTAGASEQLQSMAVRLGEELAATVRPWSLVDRSRLKRAGLLACLAVLPAVLFYLSAPGVFCAVIPRLMQPRADLPPFTRVRFDVRVEPAKVMFGRRAAIRATLSGGSVPDAADVVFVDGKRRSAPLPMKPQSGEASSFVLELPRAVRSQSFYVDTPAGRSGRYELVVHQTAERLDDIGVSPADVLEHPDEGVAFAEVASLAPAGLDVEDPADLRRQRRTRRTREDPQVVMILRGDPGQPVDLLAMRSAPCFRRLCDAGRGLSI